MVAIIITIIIAGVLGFMLGFGVDTMNKKYPEYKGEDFLDWDDNKIDSEGHF